MNGEAWPELPLAAWRDTCDTVHLWMQVVGKVKLELAPFLNEWWQVTLHVTARGMTTGLIPWRDGGFDVTFDFISHSLIIACSDGRTKEIALVPRSVAAFYAEFMAALRALDIDVTIETLPAEVPDPIRCDVDEVHASYDPEYANRWWRILVHTDTALQRFRSPFVGKSSPIHFFWGSFDLSHTRFSGRAAPPPSGPRFLRVAEDQENFTCGFWPGSLTMSGLTLDEPAYFAYFYPMPEGITQAALRPSEARWDEQVGEFLLPYSAVRTAADPARALLDFLSSVYEAGASLAGWDRAVLEAAPPNLRRQTADSNASDGRAFGA